MKAAILNSARRRETMNAGPWEGLPADLLIETTDNALVGTEAILPSIQVPEFDPDKMVGWIKTGAAVQAAGNIALGGVDFGALGAAVASGAAAGTTIPGVGTAVGAIVGAVVYLVEVFTNSVPAQWQTAAPGVHQWFTSYGPEAFLQWVREDRPELLGTTPADLTKALLLWWLERDRVVISDAPGSHYNNIPNWIYYNMAGGYDALAAMYSAVGVDFPLTRLEQHPAGTISADGVSEGLGGVWMLKRAVFAPMGASNEGGTDDGAPDNDSNSGKKLLVGGAVVASIAYLLANR